MLGSEDVLFVGRGKGVVSWYRTGSPSFAIGSDWVGVAGVPPNLALVTLLKRGGFEIPKFDDYKIVVLQQVAGKEWANEIVRLRKKGVKVLYEIDDYIHGVSKIEGHAAQKIYTKKILAEHELCMRMCTGIICSTSWLAQKYKKYNANIFVCENAIERPRYEQLNLPDRPTFNIGWAGGEGHWQSVAKWVPALDQILKEYSNVRFVAIGLPVANYLQHTNQAVNLPIVTIENFPGALCNFDIAIGPSTTSNFFAAKSDLRHLETGALGIPLVGDPFVYKKIIDGETGMLAENSADAYDAIKTLIDNPDRREEISYNVKDYVYENRSMEVKGSQQWVDVFTTVYDS